MTYVQVETGPLTDRQVGRIRLFNRQGTRGEKLRLRLSPSQLNGAGSVFLVTQTNHDKMQIAKIAGKSVLIDLSINWLRENARKGWLQLLTDGRLKGSLQNGSGPLLSAAVGSVLPSAIEVGRDILSEIFGSGSTEPFSRDQKHRALDLLMDSAIKSRIESAESLEELDNILADVEKISGDGNGQSGSGWKEALKWGALFLNPLGFITGPTAVTAKIVGKIAEKSRAGKGAQRGNGLRFY